MSVQVGVRFPEGVLLASVDRWRKSLAEPPTRPEAIRRLISIAFVSLEDLRLRAIEEKMKEKERAVAKDKVANTIDTNRTSW